MKKLMLTLALACIAWTANAQTQERVGQKICNDAYKGATDGKEDQNVRKVASFKVDAITYLNTKTLEQLTDTTRQLTNAEVAHINAQLDSMAYFMYDYLNLYAKEYSRAKNEKAKARILKLFRDVSINHPLYNDPDKELVLAYFNREDYPTQFSLDTDWVAAVTAVKIRLKGN